MFVCHVFDGKGEQERREEAGERERLRFRERERERETVNASLSTANGHCQAVVEGAWSHVHRIRHQHSMCEEGSNCSSKCVVM